ncbi:hypothetical protein A2914_02710 [Candidatus Nomurabacteria bacterium RIFCSPLOWO2_01_FULL_41_21]|uniref:Uncharacterized protein n=2 Tax=Candidatus Nomuraibacteriota TaxID=1752729 RepID=A0A1F6V1D6_9BACT|nr:MAG: hypothetical protein A2733_00355 [Candidatus Nomurabacteria bacterium RIFCSPHIGHO2_01_FULL_40_20]OGI88905.1 MAG: hypothetical protein A2914_02710 [Candidatus Nomurabacteria bacterium RIFCSPLOWO2_01_FULL_41_21]
MNIHRERITPESIDYFLKSILVQNETQFILQEEGNNILLAVGVVALDNFNFKWVKQSCTPSACIFLPDNENLTPNEKRVFVVSLVRVYGMWLSIYRCPEPDLAPLSPIPIRIRYPKISGDWTASIMYEINPQDKFWTARRIKSSDNTALYFLPEKNQFILN